MNNTDAIIALLTAAGVDAHDGEPKATPPGPYCVVYDNPGHRVPHRISTTAHWVDCRHQVVCVARTLPGLRHLIGQATDALTGRHPIPAASPLLEDHVGPVLEGGPVGDRRYTATITYRHETPRSA